MAVAQPQGRRWEGSFTDKIEQERIKAREESERNKVSAILARRRE